MDDPRQHHRRAEEPDGPSSPGRWFVRGVILVSAAIIVFSLDWFHVDLPARERAIAASPPTPRAGESCVVLAADADAIAASSRKGTFRELDLSYAWLNVLEQEVGPADLVDPERLPTVLPHARWVILSSSVFTDSFDPGIWTRHLAPWVAGGGALVLDRPNRAWLAAIGFDGPFEEREIRPSAWRVVNVETGHPQDLPLPRISLSAVLPNPDPRWTCILEAVTPTEARLPVVLGQRRGLGYILLAAADLPRLLVVTQQGMPEDDFSVVNRHTEILNPRRLETNDLVADPVMLTNDVPSADIVERAVVDALAAEVPIPRWWYFPEGATGAAAVTQDDEAFGDNALWMLEDDAEHGRRSTTFFVAGGRLTATAWQRCAGKGAGGGIHWNRRKDMAGGWDRFGIWLFRPFHRMRSLEAQLRVLEPVLGTPILVNRNHFLAWSAHYTRDFRVLAANGIRLDSSYGTDWGCRGYLFGTGLPFHPLDANGCPFRLLEVPQIWADNIAGADSAWVSGVLRDASERYHELVVSLYHPDSFTWLPEDPLGGYRTRELNFETAEALGMWTPTFPELLAWWNARAESRFAAEKTPGGLTIRYAIDHEGAAMRWDGPPPARVVDAMGRELNVVSRLHPVSGRAFSLIETPRGEGTVRMFFGEEATEP